MMCSIERMPLHLLNSNGNATDQTFESVHQSVARHMSQETSTNVAIVVSLCLVVNFARKMVPILWWDISIFESDVRIICIYTFLVASVDF